MRMSTAYGFNCKCGAEWDISPPIDKKFFKCPFCGRLINTGFNPIEMPSREKIIDEKVKMIGKGEKIDKNDLKRQRKNNTFSYSWLTSLEPGKRRRCNLTLGYYKSETQHFKVTYSEEPYEGRHMREVKSKSFTNYKAALESALEWAECYAPDKIIEEIEMKSNKIEKNV
jgi:hypothetical protein